MKEKDIYKVYTEMMEKYNRFIPEHITKNITIDILKKFVDYNKIIFEEDF